MLCTGYEPELIFFAGDSAGGNLALATSIFCRETDILPPPKGLVLISPWLDMHRSSPTMSLNDEFNVDILDSMKVAESEPGSLPYVGKNGPGVGDKEISPIFDKGELPPCIIAVGTVDR